MHLLISILGQTTTAAGGGEPPGDIGQLLPMPLMFGLLIAIMYLLMYRPQKQKEQERQDMLKRVKKNDKVVTSSGIIGVVTSLKDDEVTLRVDDAANVRIRFSRSSIAGIVGEGEMPGADEKGT